MREHCASLESPRVVTSGNFASPVTLLGPLLADLPEVTSLETTITADNSASQRLFASFAERHGAEHTIEPLFEEAHFPDPGHGAELLHTISGLHAGT